MVKSAAWLSKGIAVSALALLAHGGAATAQTYTFKASGTVSSAYSADRNFQPVPTPASTIQVGDNVTVQFALAPTGATPDSFFDADPTTNIYSYYVTDFEMRVGATFVTLPTPSERTFASFQLWNDRLISGISAPVDSFSFAILRYLPPGSSPVDLGSGLINTQFHYNAYDFTATARNSDLLTELPSLDRYGSRSGFFGFLNSDTYLQTVYQVSFTSASLTVGVPEPTTWAMLFIGFGLVGGVMRRRSCLTHNAV